MKKYYYLGPWKKIPYIDDPAAWYWGRPEETIGALDLRPCNDPSIDKYGFFATAKPLNKEYIFFGNDLNRKLTQEEKTNWASLLQIETLDSETLLEILWETLTTKADPDGLKRTKPIIPTSKGIMELWFCGHSLIKSRKFLGEDDPAWANIQKVLQNDYREIREQSLKGENTHAKETYRRVLATWQKKYKIDYKKFIPKDLPQETPLTPETTLNDTFNRTDSGSLGTASGGWDWAETFDASWTIDTNRCWEPGTSNTKAGARAQSDLSSTDHYAQSNAYLAFSTEEQGTCARYATSADTFYFGAYEDRNNFTQIYKCVTGTFTELTNSGATISDGWYDLKTEADGSTITLTVENWGTLQTTDTSITGGTRTGLWGLGRLNRPAGHEDFEAADLAVTGTNTQINISDVWKDVNDIQINISDAWKDVAAAKVNIGDVWKTIF